MKMFKAQTPLSKALLHSIPKKLYLWVQAIHAQHVHTGSHRCELKDDCGEYDITLTWDLRGYNSVEPEWSVITIDGTRFGPVTIHWDGDVFMEDGVLINNELFTDINANLMDFCELEELTYSCMEDYADQQREVERQKHDRADDLQAPPPAEV
jgi:hypothetical protein